MDVTREEQFIHQLNGKQTGAYRDLFERFYAYLVVYAMRYVQQREVAEDLVQEVFVVLWEQEKIYNSYVGLKAFLYEAVRNRALDHLKHKRVEGKYATYSLLHPMDDSDLEYKLMREEIYRKLYLAVAELPERCRRIFELHLQGKKNEEIAALLGISTETVKTQRKIAMRQLRQRLGKLLLIAILISR